MNKISIILCFVWYGVALFLTYHQGYKNGYVTGSIEGENKYFKPYMDCLEKGMRCE